MTYIYRDKNGRYAVMSPATSRIYEMDSSSISPPVAGFTREADLEEYLRWKNKENLQCPADCRYNDGGSNEEHCDHCMRDGNISDHYSPCATQRGR